MAWWIACATPARIPAAAPIAQSSRVWLTISMIVGTPRPSSPTSRAQAPRNSTSLEALERLPSLSLSRWMWKRLRSPSGVKRGSRKQESPPSACARTRNASHIGAEQNHLWPVISYSAPGPPPFERRRRSSCWRARRSRPASRSSPSRTARPSCRAPGRAARRRSAARGSAAPTPRPARAACAAPGSPSRSSRSGSRRRPRPARASMNIAARATWAPGSRLAPGQRVQAVRDPERHQLVPRRVELDLVDPVAEAVVGAQPRRVLVRLRPQPDRVRAPADRAELAGSLRGPVAALAPQRLDQHPVGLEDVVALAAAAAWLETSWVALSGRCDVATPRLSPDRGMRRRLLAACADSIARPQWRRSRSRTRSSSSTATR